MNVLVYVTNWFRKHLCQKSLEAGKYSLEIVVHISSALAFSQGHLLETSFLAGWFFVLTLCCELADLQGISPLNSCCCCSS